MSNQYVVNTACDGCGRPCPTDEIYYCNTCGKSFCPDCWDKHRRPSTGSGRPEALEGRELVEPWSDEGTDKKPLEDNRCLYCGQNPCVCDQLTEDVAETLRREGAAVTE